MAATPPASAPAPAPAPSPAPAHAPAPAAAPAPAPAPSDGGRIPYARFQKVNEDNKLMRQQLEAVQAKLTEMAESQKLANQQVAQERQARQRSERTLALNNAAGLTNPALQNEALSAYDRYAKGLGEGEEPKAFEAWLREDLSKNPLWQSHLKFSDDDGGKGGEGDNSGGGVEGDPSPTPAPKPTDPSGGGGRPNPHSPSLYSEQHVSVMGDAEIRANLPAIMAVLEAEGLLKNVPAAFKVK